MLSILPSNSICLLNSEKSELKKNKQQQKNPYQLHCMWSILIDRHAWQLYNGDRKPNYWNSQQLQTAATVVMSNSPVNQMASC